MAVLAAVNKMSYVAEVLNLEQNCEILSASYTLDQKSYKESRKIGRNNVPVQFLTTLPYGYVVRRMLSRSYSAKQLERYLLRHLDERDVLVAYHSLAYLKLIKKIKKKTQCKVVLEVEELYSDVTKKAEYINIEKMIPSVADAFIIPTAMLNQAINPYKKPYVVIHGTYQVEAQRICKNEYRKIHGWDQDKIHVVYAGTFDPRKGGALAAAAAEYLPDQYHIHILGFGSETEKNRMKDLVAELAKKSKCIITYDGLLSGEEYIQFIQSCDIGLSTQNPDAAFNATSFPSKILSYMANGLRVVSIRIPAIEDSAIGKYMYYYERQTPEEIAKAIMKVDIFDDYEGRDIIKKLDLEFRTKIRELLEELR